jgi:hypothetical protein
MLQLHSFNRVHPQPSAKPRPSCHQLQQVTAGQATPSQQVVPVSLSRVSVSLGAKQQRTAKHGSFCCSTPRLGDLNASAEAVVTSTVSRQHSQ